MIIFVAFAALVLFTWPMLMQRLGYMPPPINHSTTTQATTQAAIEPTTAPVLPSPATLPQASMGPAPITGLRAIPAPQASEELRIGSAETSDPDFALQLAINPQGAGLRQVLINDFKKSIDQEDRYSFEEPYTDAANTQPLSMRAVRINGMPVELANQAWQVVSKSEREATLAIDVADERGTRVTIQQKYEVLPRESAKADGPLGFESKVSYSFINRGDAPVVVGGTIIGPTFPPTEQPRGGDRQTIAGYNGRNAVVLRHDMLEGYTAAAATKDYTRYEDLPLLWIGAGGNYFNAIVRPEKAWVKTAEAKALNPDSEPLKREVLITLETTDVTLQPGQQQELAASVFFGPRQRDLLRNAYYSSPAMQFFHTLEISGSCAFCTLQWLVNGLMYLLSFFHWVTGDWGVAIILLVLVVRGVLHPITKRSQINMAKFSKMGPEIERLKKKHGDDKDALNRAMMQFYKQNGAAPILGCLPMLLQMPIWIALYAGLSTTFELRHQPFLYGYTWIHDLAKPDHLIEFAPQNQINFFFLHIDGINVIPFLLAIAFFLQFKMQPKPPTMTPEQEQQQKMMKWMTTFLFPLMLYTSPSGLTLYILTSTTLGIIENKIIRNHIKEREEREAANPVVVDAEVIDRPRGGVGGAASKATGGVIGWFQNLQERVEEVRREAEKKAQKNKK
jgi:YidC/Oxa1 family membrane protein insertase